jgi:hypothetical protein
VVGLDNVIPGLASKITVRVRTTATAEHSFTHSQFSAWLNGTARSPHERLLKDPLREESQGKA